MVLKGKEIFEGIDDGLDLSMKTNSPLSVIGMTICPVETLQDFGTQSAGSEFKVERKPPARKRKLSEIPGIEYFKECILENEKYKVGILKSIISKHENIAENVASSTSVLAGKLDLLIFYQNTRIQLISSKISARMQPTTVEPLLSGNENLRSDFPH